MASSIVLGTTGKYQYEFQSFPGQDWKQFVLQYFNYSQAPASSQPFVASTFNLYFPTGFFNAIPSIDVNTTGLTFTVTQNYLTIPSPPYITVPQNQVVNGCLILESF